VGKLGGFATGNNKLNPSVYPDRSPPDGGPISKAKTVVFECPTAAERIRRHDRTGRMGHLQDFVKKPSNVNGIAAALEKAAAAAYKGK